MTATSDTKTIAITRNWAGVTFDAWISETHESELAVCDSPVETGVVISDHAFLLPYKLSITAGVSDVVMHNTAGDLWSSGTSRSATAYEYLKDLQASAEPFTVTTPLDNFENMIVGKFTFSQDKDTSGALLFTAWLRGIQIVSTQTVTYPAEGQTANQSGPVNNQGQQQGSQADSIKTQSLLSKLAGTPP